MLFKLFLLFTITPLVELALLVKLGEVIGFAPTMTLVIVTGAVGAWLARQQGLRVIREFNERLNRGEMPTDPLIDGLLVVVGGALLVTPGVITDIVGFTLVIPAARAIIRNTLKTSLHASVTVSTGSSGIYYTSRGADANRKPRDDDDIIDI